MRLAVKGRLTEKYLAEIMNLLKMQPPGFSFEFDGFVTFGCDPDTATKSLETSSSPEAQSSPNGHLASCSGQAAVITSPAPATEEQLERDAEASSNEKFDRFKPLFFRDYDTQAEFDAAALRGEYPDFPAAITVRQRNTSLAVSAAAKEEQDRREQVFSRILHGKGASFIAALNAAIAEVWAEIKPVYPNNGNGGRKGAPRPMPTIEHRGSQLLLLPNTPQQTFVRIKTPLSRRDSSSGALPVWTYSEWVGTVVPRLAQVIDEFEQSILASASAAA